MKTLFLVRHAKSDRDIINLDDIDRPLNHRGYQDAHFISNFLKDKKYKLDLFISSPAVRAISTALIFARNLKYPLSKIELKQEIYEASTDDFIEVIQNIPDTHAHVMIFAHNPSITSISNIFTGFQIENIPTTGIACLEFKTLHWKTVSEKQGTLKFFDFPKNHIA